METVALIIFTIQMCFLLYNQQRENNEHSLKCKYGTVCTVTFCVTNFNQHRHYNQLKTVTSVLHTYSSRKCLCVPIVPELQPDSRIKMYSTLPVSYTHLTLPTIYSV